VPDDTAGPGLALLTPPVLLLASKPLLIVADESVTGGLTQLQLALRFTSMTVMSSRLPRCLRAHWASARAAMPAAWQPEQTPLLLGCRAYRSSTFFKVLCA